MDSTSIPNMTTISPSTFLTTEKPYRLDDPTERLLIAIFTCVISFLGIPGNVLVVFAVVISRKLQTSTNIFIANLAFSDLITCLVLPFNTAALLREEWPLPDNVCKLVAALTYITVGASIVNLALIAFNRYYLITRAKSKYEKLYRPRNIVLMIASSWLYVIAVVLIPPACGLGNLGYSHRYRVCTTDSEHPYAFYNEMLRSILMQILFLIVVLVCYVAIYHSLRKSGEFARRMNRTETFPSQSDRSDQTMQHQLRKRQLKVTKNLFIVVCAYICCILPFGVACVIPRSYVVIPWASMFALLNTCLNPFIYGINHPQFKEVYKCLLKCKLGDINEPSPLLKKLNALTKSVRSDSF